MKAIKSWIAIAGVVLGTAGVAGYRYLATLSTSTPSVAKANERVFAVEGFLREFDDADGTLVIEHEAIPGFMPAMTMPFYLEKPGRPKGFAVNDALAFDFVVGEDKSYIRNLRKIPARQVTIPVSTTAAESTELRGIKRLAEGDAVPPFTLYDQTGAAVTLDAFRGKSLLVTFIFTRCPVPDFCPLLSKNFSALNKRLQEGPGEIRELTQLMSISFDPEFDTPEMLTLYGSAFASEFTTWRFASGTKEQMDRLTAQFSVYTRKESGTISHGLCTALIDGNGTIVKIWRGNGWSVDEVLTAIHSTTLPKAASIAAMNKTSSLPLP